MSDQAIRIEGLREFQRSIKRLDSDLPKALRVAFNGAGDIVVQDARPRVASKSGKARASVKAKSTQTAVRVVGGGNKAPYYPWLDFGGRVGPKRSVKRTFLQEGRYIYASYYDNHDRVQEATVDALVSAATAAGLVVGHGE